MNTKQNVHNVQNYRESYILGLNESENKSDFAREHSESLFHLGLTMYSKEYSFESAVYNGLAVSHLDETISLHPEQMRILNLIHKNKGIVFSAPTSFGKTFVIFEYIARYKPKNVVLVVPTLALVDEYKQRVINKYSETFREYRVYLSINQESKYDFNKNNLFILTHDRVVNDEANSIIEQIDFLVIDEVYKLKKDLTNDRVLILNLAYKYLADKAQKFVLLAPFLKEIQNLDKLDSKPKFYSSNFSPVVNKVVEYRIIDDKDRNKETTKIMKRLSGKILVYFPTVIGLYKYAKNCGFGEKENEIIPNPILEEFIEWASVEIHEEWSVLKALKKGILVHNGQLPLGIRMIVLELFNDPESGYDIMLCTSTLLEGVNTSAEHIIITKPARSRNAFDAFDFFNLVGRTGRLYKYYLGKAHYIRGPKDREYLKEDALKSIEFELTSDSIDMDINSGKYDEHLEFIELLKDLKITYEEYKENLATICRFSTVKYLYDKYKLLKQELFKEINKFKNDDRASKLSIIRVLYKIIEKNLYNSNMITYIINVLTYKNPRSIRQVVERTRKAFKKADLDNIISNVIRLKSSYIEHEFYKKASIILYFMQCEEKEDLIRVVNDDLMTNIERAYFIDSPSKKMLKDIGVYDRDIEIVSEIIGENYDMVNELQTSIRENYHKIQPKIGIVSRYILNRLIE